VAHVSTSYCAPFETIEAIEAIADPFSLRSWGRTQDEASQPQEPFMKRFTTARFLAAATLAAAALGAASAAQASPSVYLSIGVPLPSIQYEAPRVYAPPPVVFVPPLRVYDEPRRVVIDRYARPWQGDRYDRYDRHDRHEQDRDWRRDDRRYHHAERGDHDGPERFHPQGRHGD
jgi:hypothetical protein